MLDLHSGSEYGAARIAAMIAAAVTIVLTVLAAFGSMVPYAQLILSALSPSMPYGAETRLRPNCLPATPIPSCASPPSQRTMMVASPHIKPSAIFPASLPIGNA